MKGQATGLAALDPRILEAVRPTTLSNQQLLDVPDALSPLFPWGGLQRGWQVGISGPGAWTLTAGMMVPSLGDEGWMAVVGAPLLNLVAGAEVGLRMDRVLVVDTPPAGQWGTVVAALLEAVQVVVICPPSSIGNRDARRIAARLREQRGTLLHLDGGATWPSGLDMRLTCQTQGWQGIGQGNGYLRYRRMRVEAAGRRSAAQPRSVSLWMPGPDGPLTSAEELATVTKLSASVATPKAKHPWHLNGPRRESEDGPRGDDGEQSDVEAVSASVATPKAKHPWHLNGPRRESEDGPRGDDMADPQVR